MRDQQSKGRDLAGQPCEPSSTASRSGGDPRAAPAGWFRRVTFYSLLSALPPLIPVPYLDDRILAMVRRSMVGALLRDQQVVATSRQVRWLSEGEGQRRGCAGRVLWLLRAATIKLVSRVVRKLVVFLTFKQCADEASKSFHLGYLLHYSLRDGQVRSALMAPSDSAGSEHSQEPWELRFHGAMSAALAGIDHRPIEQLFKRSFRGSRRLLLRASRTLRRKGGARQASDSMWRDQEEQLGGTVDQLSAELRAQRHYFTALERKFELHLAAREEEATR